MSHHPQCSATHASIHHALKYKLCMENWLSAPKSAVVDGVISYGGSTGIGLNLPRKAYGEFYERNHLFTKVPLDETKPLSKVEPQAFRQQLLSLCHHRNQATLEHSFAFTKVKNIFDNQVQDYFYNAICLNGLKADSAFLSFSDSCGCACHPVFEKALYNSLMEFLERQALLGSWLSKTYQYTVDSSLLAQVTPYTDLCERLLDNGEIFIFANGNHLPGHTLIMFYFAHSAKDKVQYSVGSSSGLSLKEALTSSLEELYQCYSFLYNMESSKGLENKAGSGYHLSFQDCNYAGVKNTIPFFEKPIAKTLSTLEEFQAMPVFTYESILSGLKQHSCDIYYYHFYEQALNLHYTKIMSPDFFAHMSIANLRHFDNAYAKKMGISAENAYLGKIPFP